MTAVSARDRTRDRGVSVEGLTWHDDPVALATDVGVDVVVEVIGGSEGPAARHGAGRHPRRQASGDREQGAARAAWRDARRRGRGAGVPLAFEAAVAGGIPAIKALREGLAANEIRAISGILNGTCNYILTVMREQGRDFAEVLADAQRLGYAEADPAFDIDGVDAAHKLAILARTRLRPAGGFRGAACRGHPADHRARYRFRQELGFRIKLLGIAQRQVAAFPDARPSRPWCRRREPIAQVDGVFNAVVAEGDFSGRVMLMGRGAGAGPTASAVVADLIDIARGRLTPIWGAEGHALETLPALPMSAHQGAYYLRLMVLDRPGVIADVTAVLRDDGVSLQSMLQHGRAPGEAVPIVLVTHETNEAAMMTALARIAALPAVSEPRP